MYLCPGIMIDTFIHPSSINIILDFNDPDFYGGKHEEFQTRIPRRYSHK